MMSESTRSRAEEEEIVSAAVHQALSGGANHVTTTEIAQATGLRVPVVYARMCALEERGLVSGELVAVRTKHGKELRERGSSDAVGAIAWQSASPEGYAGELADVDRDSTNRIAPHRPAHTDLPLDMDTYVPHGRGPLSRAMLRLIRSGPAIAKIGRHKIYAVDGAAVRNRVHIDFTTGGNPGRYSYVPEGEVWVERVLEPPDMAASLLHEMVETTLMEEGGLDYDAAHEEASAVETALRAQMQWTPGTVSKTSRSEAAQVASAWYDRWLKVRRVG